MDGWKNVFSCDEDGTFHVIGNFDLRCASLGTDVDDVLAMSEMCPICLLATGTVPLQHVLSGGLPGTVPSHRAFRVVT